MQTRKAIALAAGVLTACVNEPPAEPPVDAQQTEAVVEADAPITAAEEANEPEAAALTAALAVEIEANESRAANTFRAALVAAAGVEANNDVKVIFQATIKAFKAAEAAVKAAEAEAATYYNIAKAEAETCYLTAEAAKDSTKAAANAAANATANATSDDAKTVIKAMLKLTNAKDAYTAAKDAFIAAKDALKVAQKVHHTAYLADRDFKRFTSEDSRGYPAEDRAAQNAYNFAKDYTAAH